jgi:glycosyltransferase involved in cell wall biosynthesis
LSEIGVFYLAFVTIDTQMSTIKSVSKALPVSIVIPAWNEENHLVACLEAIKKQTVKPAAVIVVNNNSTDRTVDIARRYSFVRLLDEPRQGVVYARNRGFNAVKSGVIGRIDADTIVPTDWVERVESFFAVSDLRQNALTGGCYFYNMRWGHFIGWFQGQIAFRTNRLLLGHYIVFGSNMALPVAVWKKVKPTLCLRGDIHEDLDLAIHLHRAGHAITYHENLKVGIKLRRLHTDRGDMWKNLMWWPKTLKVHHIRTWVFGWLGAVMLYALTPISHISGWIGKKLGKPPLE